MVRPQLAEHKELVMGDAAAAALSALSVASEGDAAAATAGDDDVKLASAEMDPKGSVLLEFDGEKRGMFGRTLMERATDEFERTGEFPAVSEKFLACAKGNKAEAQRRWEATLRWRADQRINNLVRTPQRQFEVIKKHYPHFLHGKSRKGCQVYFEQVGKIDLKGLYADGATFEGLVSHYMFLSEFLYTYVQPEESARTITVIDCAHLALRKLPGDVIKFIRTCNRILGQHYPETAEQVLIINVPIFFSLIWRVISPFVDPVTLKKVRMVRGKSAVQKVLLEHIAVEELPREYGGESQYALGDAPEERLLRELVSKLNEAPDKAKEA